VDGYGSHNFVKKEVAGGGALYDMGIYHIARMLYLLGQPKVERVSGKVEQQTDIDPGRYAISGFTVEEFATGYVRFGGGLTMDIIEVWAAHMGELGGSSIFGSKGGVRLDPLTFHTTLSDVPINATFEADGADWRWHQLNPDLRHYDSSQIHWVAALRGEVELLPSAELALTTSLISEGIYLSDKLGREVTADEVREQSTSTSLPVD
jgi:predicted dehydrogenase